MPKIHTTSHSLSYVLNEDGTVDYFDTSDIRRDGSLPDCYSRSTFEEVESFVTAEHCHQFWHDVFANMPGRAWTVDTN